MMKKIEVELYKYEELTEEVQKKLLKEEIDHVRDDYLSYFLQEELEVKARDELYKNFVLSIDDINLCYDFSYCQGLGVVTEFSFYYKDELFEVKLNPRNFRYTFTSNFVINYDENDSKVSNDEIEEIRKKIINLNEKLYKYGQNLIEDEEAYRNEALLILNDYDEIFLKSGEKYKE